MSVPLSQSVLSYNPACSARTLSSGRHRFATTSEESPGSSHPRRIPDVPNQCLLSFDVPKATWDSARREMMRILLEELDTILKGYRAQKLVAKKGGKS